MGGCGINVYDGLPCGCKRCPVVHQQPMALKTVIFKEMELLKEGVTAAGKPWQKYNYYGNDGEHYVLFGKLELEKPYQLAQKTREYQGKTYTDWIVVPEGGSKQSGGAKAVLDRLEGLAADITDIKQILIDQVVPKLPLKDEQLPF